MDSRIIQYYRLCGLVDVNKPLYSSLSTDEVSKIFTGKHVTVMLCERNGLYYPRETVIGASDKKYHSNPKITVFVDG